MILTFVTITPLLDRLETRMLAVHGATAFEAATVTPLFSVADVMVTPTMAAVPQAVADVDSLMVTIVAPVAAPPRMNF